MTYLTILMCLAGSFSVIATWTSHASCHSLFIYKLLMTTEGE